MTSSNSGGEVRLNRIVVDQWLGISWCREKWQILALLRGEELEFCDGDAADIGVVGLPPLPTGGDPTFESLTTCVDGEYAAVEIGGERFVTLRIGTYFVVFRPLIEPWSALPRGSLRNTRVLWLGDLVSAPTPEFVREAAVERHIAPARKRRMMALSRRAEGSALVLRHGLIVQALTVAGGEVVERPLPAGAESDFDLVVWSEDLEVTVANPLAVVVRDDLPNDTQVKRLLAELDQSDLNAVLVVYADGAEKTPISSESAYRVLPIRTDVFFEALARMDIGDLILELRQPEGVL